MSKLVVPVIERFYECQVWGNLIYVRLSKKCVNLKKAYCLRTDGMKYTPNNFEYELRFQNMLVLNRRYENVVVEYDYEYEPDEIKENKNMTITEKIDALEKELAELKEQIKTDVVADYRNGGGRTSYAVSFDNVIIPCPLCNDYPNNTYYYHHTKEYAKMAMEMKEFNDKLLAFKWCYDRDYVPDWSDGNESKYVVVYDSRINRYEVELWTRMNYNTVHFSTIEIAQKCCDWLNGIEKENN